MAVRRQDADHRERDSGHNDQRRQERLEPANHQPIDQDQHCGEGDTEIAKYFARDVSLAAPLHRVAPGIRRKRRHMLLDLVAFGNLDFVDLRPEFQNPVNRTLDLSAMSAVTYITGIRFLW
jgi:hypothetical protein